MEKVVGGPLDGATLAPGMAPWAAWIPREPGDTGPPRTLTPEEVFEHPHYVRLGDVHVWRPS